MRAVGLNPFYRGWEVGYAQRELPLEGRVFCQFVAGSTVESASLSESPEGGLALKHEVRGVGPGDGERVALGSGVAPGLRSVAAHSQEVYAHFHCSTVDKITIFSSYANIAEFLLVVSSMKI